MTANLATFVDRYTMRHARIYPHPLDRVWTAITDDKHASVWFGFPVRFNMRVGGICAWGPAQSIFYETKISVLDPKTLVQHDNVPPGDAGYMRFELAEHPDGSRLDFVQHFDPAASFPEYPDPEMSGGDLPGGSDTPWRPNFVGGFHAILDNLGNLLDGAPLERGQETSDPFARELIDQWLLRQVRFEGLGEATAAEYRRQLHGTGRWMELNKIYRKHIRKTIPSK
jgi:uncharacterized protein YndB with AHSA1/START domain